MRFSAAGHFISEEDNCGCTLDRCSDSFDSVALGNGLVLYLRRVCAHSSGARDRRCSDSGDPGSKSGLSEKHTSATAYCAGEIGVSSLCAWCSPADGLMFNARAEAKRSNNAQIRKSRRQICKKCHDPPKARNLEVRQGWQGWPRKEQIASDCHRTFRGSKERRKSPQKKVPLKTPPIGTTRQIASAP